MIKRLLVANRGEIAVRIIRACRELGIESVAVFSDADTRARHVLVADRAIAIGPAAPAESYLSGTAIVEAAHRSGADAVHPGYGFLSENADFSARCERAGLIFVGPPTGAIARMGSKIAARSLMRDAGIPVVPGETPREQSDAGVLAAIDRVGTPCLVKASAGGGGKGLRLVSTHSEAVAAIQAARREAMAAFGDGTLYVERLINRPHHVEVQVMGDAHGHMVHVFERECSAQRRHQKVIEECPSPSIDAQTRQKMTQAAVCAAKAAGYQNAGTVEFLVDVKGKKGKADAGDLPFYFLEMNTRLQVEHPVTEQAVGIDLVRAQLLVASGEPLPWRQEQLTLRGHAIEARIYAEDPARDFLPQAGPVRLYREPLLPGVRVDSGLMEGDEVSVHYDPLLAKVIATAETRPLAVSRLSAALRDFPILGIRTNAPFLLRVLDSNALRDGRLDTSFLDGPEAAAFAEESSDVPDHVLSIMEQHEDDGSSGPVNDPWLRLAGWRG